MCDVEGFMLEPSYKTSLNMHVVIRVPFFEQDEMF